MIRKTLILGVIALAALAAGAPALLGLYMAREFDAAVARLEQPGVTRVLSSRFSRGWFRSDATIRIGLDEALCPQRPCPAVTLDSVIHHGPLAFGAPRAPGAGLEPSLGVAVTRMDLASLWPRLVFEPPLSPLRIVTRVGFDGRALSKLDTHGASHDVSRQRPIAHIDIGALHLRAGVSLRGGGVDARLDAPQFRLIGETGGQLAWRKLTVSSGSTLAGEAEAGQQLRVDSLTLADGLGTAALLEGIVAQWQPLPAARERVSARFSARASRAVLDNNDTGPFMIDGALRRIDPAAWRALYRQIGRLRDERSGALDPGARALLYREAVPRVLAGAPVVDIRRLLLTTPNGDIGAHLHLAAPAKPRPARMLADVISQLEVDFAARLPAPLVRDIAVQVMLANGRSPYDIENEDIDKALAELVAQGLIETRPDAASFRVALQIEHGLLRLNGRNQIGWQSVVDRFEAARERL